MHKVLERFNRLAGTYDKSFLQGLVFRRSHKRLLREINPDGDGKMRVLDVGCGTGELALKLSAKSQSIEIDGLDLSDKMIDEAKKKSENSGIQFKTGSACSLPYADETFDVVTCAHSFHHYKDQKKAVSEMHRVLKVNGRLMLMDGSRDTFFGKFLFGFIIKKLEKEIYHSPAGELKALFHRSGFYKVVQKIHFPIPILFTIGTKAKRVL